MLAWVALAVVAQIINAGVALTDKYIVTSEKLVPRPLVYTFYTCILAGAWIGVFLVGLLPIDLLHRVGLPSFANVSAPDLSVTIYALLAGYAFFVALIALYSALREADTSDVVPVVGAVSAAASFLFSYIFLGTELTPNFLIGLFLLSAGTFLVSHLRFRFLVALMSICSGFFFAVHYVLLKQLFNATSFDNGFFWSRAAFFVVALSMFLVPGIWKQIHTQTKKTTRQGGILVLGNKFLAGIASILILKATALGSVAVVQALGGLQFLFILLFTMFFGNKTPVECGENLTCDEDVYHKAIFISVITLGFVVLFI